MKYAVSWVRIVISMLPCLFMLLDDETQRMSRDAADNIGIKRSFGRMQGQSRVPSTFQFSLPELIVQSHRNALECEREITRC